MSFLTALWSELGVTPTQAVAIVTSTLIMYFALAFVLREWGQRLYANRSGTGIAVVLVVGAVSGRAMLGNAPTLAGGLICLATLIACETVFGMARQSMRLKHRKAVVVWDHGQAHIKVMRAYHLSRHTLQAALRQAGLRSLDEIQAVVLEPNGSLSLIRSGSIDPELLEDVEGSEVIIQS